MVGFLIFNKNNLFCLSKFKNVHVGGDNVRKYWPHYFGGGAQGIVRNTFYYFFIYLFIFFEKINKINFFTFTIHIGSNCYINIGVHDLLVTFFKANST